eukprot:m.278811 g.278811  ORF g.278811 m.278811 type:complete len:464 (-) comp54893_c2_seq4:832-2223(-)
MGKKYTEVSKDSMQLNVDVERDVKQPPIDKFNLTYIIFFLQGVGTLLPWNAFITVTSYFKNQLNNTAFEGNFSNYFTFGFQFTGVSALIFLVKYGDRIPLRARIAIPMLIQLIIFSLVTLFTKVSVSGSSFFYITFILVLVSGAAGAFVQGGIFGMAGQLPFKYTQAVMSGQALGGFIISVLNVVTLAASDTRITTDDDTGSGQSTDENSIDTAALMFFAISVGCILVCFILFLWMDKLEFVRYYREIVEQQSFIEEDIIDESTGLISGRKRTSIVVLSVRSTFSKIKSVAFSVFMNFGVTLAVFPALTAEVKSNASNAVYAHTYFIPVYCFVLFNLADWLGRICAGFYQIPGQAHASRMPIPTLGRLIFVALFALLHLRKEMYSYSLFDDDAWAYVFMLLFGMTNGYFGSLCMMYGPSIVDANESEFASIIMVTSLNLGLTAGTITSFGIKAMLCRCNPFHG